MEFIRYYHCNINARREPNYNIMKEHKDGGKHMKDSPENDPSADHNLDKELKDLIELSELKSEALKKMMNKLNEKKNTDHSI